MIDRSDCGSKMEKLNFASKRSSAKARQYIWRRTPRKVNETHGTTNILLQAETSFLVHLLAVDPDRHDRPGRLGAIAFVYKQGGATDKTGVQRYPPVSSKLDRDTCQSGSTRV